MDKITIIAELSKRGISNDDFGSKGKRNDDKIKKAFDDLKPLKPESLEETLKRIF